MKGILKNKNNNDAFFGYYDKSPWSYDGKYYLVHIFNKKFKDRVKIFVYNCEKDSLNIIDETPAFNIQQGAMLRWLDKKNYYCIYNTLKDECLVAKIRDIISGKEIKTIPMPIQTVNHEGIEALVINYKRLYKIRPEYGYNINVKNFSSDMPYEKDGIWRINFNTGKSKLIITLADLISLDYNKTMDKSQHKINHIIYSPLGKRFIFMHRWIGPYGKFSRLYTVNSDGSGLYCLLDNRIVSHYCWLDNKHLIVWGRKNNLGNKYYLLLDKSNKSHVIGNGVLDAYGDGHPSISPDKKWLITDTYPDKGRIRELILFNLITKNKIIVGKFFAPWMYDGSYRCDLHPRWSPDGSKISIDSTHEGFRNSYIIDVKGIINNDR